ncbi:MAG: TIR domain-containing protein [Verrucomicrobia bacterium]|nr:TIR domain-containing protein [Verrucomicrobiota bacterium]
MKCPQCQAEATKFGAFWICPTHGQLPEPKPHVPMRIFLSYGHDANEELVRRIKADLEKRGHDVWFDKNEIKFGDEWRRAITDGILNSHRVLSFLSKHSTRDPGVCRDEIAIAIGVKGGNIQTVLVESEQEVQPPVNIGHIQWLDMHDWKERRTAGAAAWEQWYQAKLAEIVRVVESDESRRFAGEIETLNGHLKPIKSEARICQLLSKGFYGRQWLFEAVEKWRQDTKRDSRLFWILGAPGVGKSAFAAQLTHTRGDTVIAAQFCEWDKPDHRNAARVVRSLAFQLATRLPDYRKLLLTLPEIAELDRKDAAELADYLLANPLRSVIRGGRERYLIVIDALDEASRAGRNPLVEMLARNAQRLPDWIGLVVTSRPEFDVKTPLQALNPFPLDAKSESNRADIRDYLRRELATPLQHRPDADRLVEQILEKSEGVFLYVERFCDDVQRGHLSLDRPEQFPQGLGGIFCQYFQRQFPDLDKFRKDVRPALRAILAAREPLPVEILQRLFNWQDEELRDFTRPLASLFPITTEAGHEVIKSYHKSLADWLADEGKSGPYLVSVSEGHRMLADLCWHEYQKGVENLSDYGMRHIVFHLVLVSRSDEARQVNSDSAFCARRERMGIAPDDEVRAYVSSTFRDMHAERDHLVTVVFPELRERVERLGLEFFDVDLRWGVPETGANGETANSWEYCRQWIDRVEPFFVSLLGQRYGYIPPPHQLRDPADREALAGLSITEMEIRHAVLSGRIRRRSLFYFRQARVPEDAGEAAKRVFVEDDDKVERLKNQIKAGSRPVREYPCRWTGRGFAELEPFGQMVLEDLWSGVLRDERYVSKEVWRQVLGTDPDTDSRYTDESQPVPSELWQKIVALAGPAPVSPLDAERQQMEAFAASRVQYFQGRTHELQQLTHFINSTNERSPRLATVVAVPGQGKSALLARLSTFDFQLSTFIITHFVGATERSASAHALVERLLGELDRSSIAWSAEQQKKWQESGKDFNSLCLQLAQRLGEYAGERRIVILLDALNQLSDGHDLQWLPARLGSSVRVIASCVEDATAKADSPEQRVFHALTSRQSESLRVPLGPLMEADVRTIIVAYFKAHFNELDCEHLDALCAITAARNPLYLLVMLNELRTLAGDDLNRIAPALIASMSQNRPDTVSLFRWVLQRLEVFGPEAVQWWCLYLAHSRGGMASHELADLLARKFGADAVATALLIERGLRRYLVLRGPKLDFSHNQLRQAVFDEFGPKVEAAMLHADIANYRRCNNR